MSYSPQTWTDGPAGGTPISAARLTHIEDGLVAASVGELDAARLYSWFTIPNTNTWTDLPMQITVPAGVPWTCHLAAMLAATRNATADATIKQAQMRLVDPLDLTKIYGYIAWQDPFATASISYIDKKVDLQPNDPLSVDTVLKVQGIATANANTTWTTYNAVTTVPTVAVQAVAR